MKTTKEYVLMHKRTPVAVFLYDVEAHAVVRVGERINLEHAPLGALDSQGNMTRMTLGRWWGRRAIPASRHHIDALLSGLGIDASVALVERSFGLSLSDRYWVNDAESPQEWDDVNFFDNDFSDDLGLVTIGESTGADLSMPSPSATLGGMLQKKWVVAGGQRRLMKAGSGFVSQEVYNEVAATALHRLLLAPGEYVPYSLEKVGGRTYCSCPNMLGPDEELVPAADLLGRFKRPNHVSDHDHLVDVYGRIGIDAAEKSLSKMFACDFVLANRDRHYNNFGVIRNAETLEFLRAAPIFDSGTSLWCWQESLEDESDLRYLARPFGTDGIDPREQVELFDPSDWIDMRSLAEFPRLVEEVLGGNPNMPKDRVALIVGCVERNIREMAALVQGERVRRPTHARPANARRGLGR